MIDWFYELLARSMGPWGGSVSMGALDNAEIPSHGVYYFFEPDEVREDGTAPRVVRVGSHALTPSARSRLVQRLMNHRGTGDGGNHRGSIFRLRLGEAILARDPDSFPEAGPSWGRGQSASHGARVAERELERHVSTRIEAMTVAWIAVSDEAGGWQARNAIEQGSIALLSNWSRATIDPPSPGWLGAASPRPKIRHSGLWNSRHVDEPPPEDLITRVEQVLDAQTTRSVARGSSPQSQRDMGWTSLSWGEINRRIAACRESRDPVVCLDALFDETRDGNVAFALGEEAEGRRDLARAADWYRIASERYPKRAFKDRAKASEARVRGRAGSGPASGTPGSGPVHVVACSKTKIWDSDANAPDFVPAREAYRGRNFLRARRWLDQGWHRWLILSARYGFIEPEQPISNYDVTFSDPRTGPLSIESLIAQVAHQSRHGRPLSDLRDVRVLGSRDYLDRVRAAFEPVGARVSSASHGEHST